MKNFDILTYIKNKESNLYKYDYSMIYGYIYITLLPDGRYYIGQKKYLPEQSLTYFGSSKHLNNIIKKLTGFPSTNLPIKIANQIGIDKIILDYAIDQTELNYLEIWYITKGKSFEEYEGQCLNIHNGGQTSENKPKGKFYLTKESIEQAKATRKRKREAGLLVVSEETKQKMSIGIKEARKKKPVWNKGLTKETDDRVKKLLGKRDTSYTKSPEYKANRSKISKGTTWYNNGIKNIRLKDGDIIPDGYVPGMLGKSHN